LCEHAAERDLDPDRIALAATLGHASSEAKRFPVMAEGCRAARLLVRIKAA